ncbi:tumor necrosis factor receptor superfamily member 19L [Heliangelus exortis]|uniref:tumor necrosis factor receptor superfamily member 19L n=1 Tax=Heliangelus exortis TaxID=472823 RepID=UPI003A934CC5
MKRSGMCWWLITVLGVLSGSSAGSHHSQDPRMPGCPPGEEPTVGGPSCRVCPPGTFSPGNVSCSAHTRCQDGNRILVAPGTLVTDTSCGSCLPGFYSPGGEREPRGRCLPCATAPHSTPGCPARRRIRSPETPDWPTGSNGTRVVPRGEKEEEEEEEEEATQAAVLTVVPVFCTMGLLGILVCNLLKKKGFYCTTAKDPQPSGPDPTSIYHLEDDNEDTIGVLVRLITEKKENAAALEELLKEHHGHHPMSPLGCTPPDKLHLLPQFPSPCQHFHTVQGPSPCARCEEKKWPQILPPPSPPSPPSPVTTHSVGRFQVSRIPRRGARWGVTSPGVPSLVGVGWDPPG